MSKKVLLISSDPGYLSRTAALISHANLSVNGCSTLDQALAHIETGDKPDIVVLDEEISESGVWSSCDRLRRLCSAPILITGTRADSLALIRAIDQGADFYLKRPFSEAEFVVRIMAMVRRYHFSGLDKGPKAVES